MNSVLFNFSTQQKYFLSQTTHHPFHSIPKFSLNSNQSNDNESTPTPPIVNGSYDEETFEEMMQYFSSNEDLFYSED